MFVLVVLLKERMSGSSKMRHTGQLAVECLKQRKQVKTSWVDNYIHNSPLDQMSDSSQDHV